jgi:lipoprotein-releasing system permease protein
MNVPLFIAKRYFFSKKKKNFISIISNISMVGVAVGTMALVVALSVFNGLEDMLRSLYGAFDPEIKVAPAVGKTFEVDSLMLMNLASIEGVELITEVIEDNALAKYKESLMVVKVKGVSENFVQHHRMDSAIISGRMVLHEEDENYAVMGVGVKFTLGVSVDNQFFPLQLWYPRRQQRVSLNPQNAFNRRNILPGGIFTIEKTKDDQYVFVPLSFAQELMNYEQQRTALEIKTLPGHRVQRVQQAIKEQLGDGFLVQNSDEQHESLLRAIRIERLFIFITFAFIICVASFNIFFSLSMLAIEKKRDVAILFSIGASSSIIKKIFIIEGAIIAFAGAFVGLTLGFIICFAQQQYGIVSMGMDSALIDAYPVKMELMDFVFSALLIVVITLIATYRPATSASKELQEVTSL